MYDPNQKDPNDPTADPINQIQTASEMAQDQSNGVQSGNQSLDFRGVMTPEEIDALGDPGKTLNSVMSMSPDKDLRMAAMDDSIRRSNEAYLNWKMTDPNSGGDRSMDDLETARLGMKANVAEPSAPLPTEEQRIQERKADYEKWREANPGSTAPWLQSFEAFNAWKTDTWDAYQNSQRAKRNAASVAATTETPSTPGVPSTPPVAPKAPVRRDTPADIARRANQDAIAAGATASEARQAGRDAYNRAIASSRRPAAGMGMPTSRAGNSPTVSAGVAGRSAPIVGTPNGPAYRGANGATMPFVEDPITGDVLPLSSMNSQDEYISNLDDKTRATTISVLSEGNNAIAKEFQRIDSDMQKVDVDPNLSYRQKVAAKEQLKQQQNSLLYSSMRDPSSIMQGRSRTAQQNEMMARQEAAKSQSAAERQMALQQRANAQLYDRSYKQAEAELSSDPFNAATPQQIHARAMSLYLQSGGQAPGSPQTTMVDSEGRPITRLPGQAVGAGAPSATSAGIPSTAPAGAGGAVPSKSGAPDSSAPSSPIAIDPESPIDFQMIAPGKMATFLPDGSVMRAMNFNGRAVAVPANQADIDRLPPGSLYVLEGDVRRGKMTTPIRKPGETATTAGSMKENETEQQFHIGEGAKKLASEEAKTVDDYREQKALYDDIERNAIVRAAQSLGLNIDTDFSRNKHGILEPTDAALAKIKPKTAVGATTAGEYFRYGSGEKAQYEQVDRRGVWAATVQDQMKAVASEKFATSNKPMPDWIMRDRTGTGIAAISKPSAPAGYDENRDYTKPSEANIAEAERRFYESRGTTKTDVQNERMLKEAKSQWRSVAMDSNGRPSINYGGRQYPAVSVKSGNTTARLPAAMPMQGKTAEDVGKQALSLLLSGQTFAVIDQNGRAVPHRFDPNDPLIQGMRAGTKQGTTLAATKTGGATQMIGAQAGFAYVNKYFGYLPVQSRKFILDNLLTNERIGKGLGGYKLE